MRKIILFFVKTEFLIEEKNFAIKNSALHYFINADRTNESQEVNSRITNIQNIKS